MDPRTRFYLGLLFDEVAREAFLDVMGGGALGLGGVQIV